MRNNIFIFVLMSLAFAKAVTAQSPSLQDPIELSYYLPADVTYDPAIPTPQEILGYVPGEWHVSHDQIVHYMNVISEKSDRFQIENRGRTYEGRPLILMTVSSPENLSNIDQIKSRHKEALQKDGVSREDDPIVVYQGFSIHGNEASGSNAALVLAYHLAAAQGDEIVELLNNTVILFDPCFNPDGVQRFSTWVNQHKNKNITSNSYDREYDEVWPGGRTNHYWFDMNRDWLPVQLPESQARIKTFHDWMPNILTDHHEMGTNATFFFQPGIPSRTHPLTPKLNQELTRKIGDFHAEALDKIGSLYYTEESYDDFYYGKGSTFPDINGGIGILFEQASSRGHAQDSENGLLTFPYTVRNQFTAALSTLKAANSMRDEILEYQEDFYKKARQETSRNSSGIVFGDAKDLNKTNALAEILMRHDIQLHKLNSDANFNGKNFKKGSSYFIPKNQMNSRLINAMFEKRTTFQDSLFYDISAWTLPLAFNLDYAENVKPDFNKQSVTELIDPATESQLSEDAYAYFIPWEDHLAPRVLNQLHEKDIRVKVAMSPFSIDGRDYDYGTLMVPVQNQALDKTELLALMRKLSDENNVIFYQAKTGLTTGIDLGSRQFRLVKPQNIALLIGNGVSPYDAGEIWHLMDQRYDISITKIDLEDINRKDLGQFTTIIVPSTYGSPENEVVDQLKRWTREGGNLIGYRNSLRWMSSSKMLPLEFKKADSLNTNVAFKDRSNLYGAQNIGGAIFEAKLDRSHPINFGYSKESLPLFRNTSLFIQPDKNGFNNPIQYTSEPLLSGYISEENLKALKETVPFQHSSYGRGEVSGFTDNTQFRAFWYGTNKLLANAIFFAEMM